VKFTEAELPGVWWIDPEPASDERGFFARLFDEGEFAAQGLPTRFPQVSLSHNARRGTLRGLHYQEAPYGEAKLITCVAGAAFDVVVDVRPNSPTYHRHLVTELNVGNRRLLYVPEGLAHGFVALEDATDLLYHISASYQPAAARGLRWDDPRLNIPWPPGHRIMSARDREWPLLPG
jgi:dTDP-4-dehydrorhamnose 3,5-epimerase